MSIPTGVVPRLEEDHQSLPNSKYRLPSFVSLLGFISLCVDQTSAGKISHR
jgi:hypothetical protein